MYHNIHLPITVYTWQPYVTILLTFSDSHPPSEVTLPKPLLPILLPYLISFKAFLTVFYLFAWLFLFLYLYFLSPSKMVAFEDLHFVIVSYGPVGWSGEDNRTWIEQISAHQFLIWVNMKQEMIGTCISMCSLGSEFLGISLKNPLCSGLTDKDQNFH